jgi:hypothetical protein
MALFDHAVNLNITMNELFLLILDGACRDCEQGEG